MIFVHYDRVTGKVFGAYHESCDNIPQPTIKLEDAEWSKYAASDVKVNIQTFALEVIKKTSMSDADIDALRREAYIKEADPLFFKYQRKECKKSDWTDKIKEIKKRYPKSDD